MSATQRFRKKPVVIEAMHLVADDVPNETAHVIAAWCGGTVEPSSPFSDATYSVSIHTLEGTMTASPGDWVIRGVQGEFYPCKPDIFEATYEAAEDATDVAAAREALAEGGPFISSEALRAELGVTR